MGRIFRPFSNSIFSVREDDVHLSFYLMFEYFPGS